MGFSVRGHICIRRKAKDGNPGEAGKSIRTTVWETGKQYYAGDTQVDGVYPLDIVADKAMSIGVSGVNFYMCRTSHTSASNIPLTNTAYWTKLNNLKPVVTYLILAEAIKANLIDVADLAANSAFINNLYVKHLSGADGDFSGQITAQSGFIDGTLRLNGGGSIQSIGTNSDQIKIDNAQVKVSDISARPPSVTIIKTGISIHQVGPSGTDYGIEIGPSSIKKESTNAVDNYAVFANGNYTLSVVSQLPSSPSSSTIYIVTGTQKGVYLGSTQIA